jgi:hypothetical protein
VRPQRRWSKPQELGLERCEAIEVAGGWIAGILILQLTILGLARELFAAHAQTAPQFRVSETAGNV